MIALFLALALADEPAARQVTLGLATIDDEQDLARGAPGALETTMDEMRAIVREEGFASVDDGKDAFGQDTPVRFVLGGELAEARCRGWVGAYGCEIGIRWRLLDAGRSQVLWEAVGRGFATDALGTFQAARGATRDALRQALRRPSLREALGGAAPAASFEADLAVRRCPRKPVPLPGGFPAAMDAAVEIAWGDVRGMGFFVSPDGFVLTAAHVVRGAEDVELRDQAGGTIPARVLRVDPAHDVAVLHAEVRERACLPLQDAAAETGSDLWVLGGPRGDEAFSVMRGVVSATRTLEGVRLLQTDAAVNPGDSGGAMLDTGGSVRAIVSMKIAGEAYEGLGFGVPVGAAVERLRVALGTASDPDPRGRAVAQATALATDAPNVTGYDAWVEAQVAAAARRAAEAAEAAKPRRKK